jgi:hypothetical protein
MRLFNPDTGKWVGYNMNQKDAYKHGALLRNHYGTTPESVCESTNETRRDVVRTSAKAYQIYESYLQRRHKVSAPKYGLKKKSSDGPRLHVASGAANYIKELLVSEDGPRLHVADGAMQHMSMLTSGVE